MGSCMVGKAMAGRYCRESAKCGRGQLSGDYCLSTRPWVVGHSLLRSKLSVTPRHEFIQLCDLVVGDAAKNVGEPSLIIWGTYESAIGRKRKARRSGATSRHRAMVRVRMDLACYTLPLRSGAVVQAEPSSALISWWRLAARQAEQYEEHD